MENKIANTIDVSVAKLKETFNLTGKDLIIAYVILGIGIAVLLLSLGLFIMWIYYSWIRRGNSKGYTGEDITKYMFKTTKTKATVVSSFFYIKYWNFNKRKATHKLRPWTFKRKSLWTLMEASQQAYATTIRGTKGKQFWIIFRLPTLFKIIGVIGAALTFYFGMKGIESIDQATLTNWVWFSSAFAILLISYTFADAGKVFVLWKNVVPMLEDSGLTKMELKAINRIFFWRLVYSIVIVIVELAKTVFEVAQQANRN